MLTLFTTALVTLAHITLTLIEHIMIHIKHQQSKHYTGLIMFAFMLIAFRQAVWAILLWCAYSFVMVARSRVSQPRFRVNSITADFCRADIVRPAMAKFQIFSKMLSGKTISLTSRTCS